MKNKMTKRKMERAIKRFNDKANRKEIVAQFNKEREMKKFYESEEGKSFVSDIIKLQIEHDNIK